MIWRFLKLFKKNSFKSEKALRGLLKSEGVELKTFGGIAPFQAEGELKGKSLYFRARGADWQLHIYNTDDDLFSGKNEQVLEGVLPDAGYMNGKQGLACLLCAVMIHNRREDKEPSQAQ